MITTGTTRRPRHDLVLAARRHEPGACDELVEAFLPFIGSVARNYRHTRAVTREELMQEGVVGLLRALDRFDPTLGTPFWAYASWWVRQAMQKLVAELSGPVVLSDRAMRQLAHVRDARREFIRTHSREPSVPELAVDAELGSDHVHCLIGAERPARGLDEPVGDGDGSGARFGDSIADPRGEDAFDDVVAGIGVEHVPALLDCLSERERTVIRARYGIGGAPRTLRELAGVLGVSGERVRQIEQCALERMRREAEGARELEPAC
ncbi:MAG: polymerase primary sigma factor [Solirubrobacteraceae bacterium]|jgi:RNA polymerase sigma factor (sigma-70 family)|nr:polymerase primary sigma factor [Solirubrobacteraceae bacterium]